MKRKTVSVVVAVLCLALCVTFMPSMAFATGGGSGEAPEYSITWKDGKTTFDEPYYNIMPSYPGDFEMGDQVTVNEKGKAVKFTFKFNDFYDTSWKSIEEHGYDLSYFWKEQYDFYGADEPSENYGKKYIYYYFLYKVDDKGQPVDKDGNAVEYPTDAEVLTISKPLTVISRNDNINITIKGILYYVYNGTKTANVINSNKATVKGSIKIPQKIKIKGKEYPLTSIDGNAFSGCKKLTAVELPNTLKSIASHAFLDTAIKRIAIPESVDAIGDCAIGYMASVDKNTKTIVFKKVPGFVIYANSDSVGADYAYNEGFKLITQKDAKKMKPKLRAKAKKGRKVCLNWSKKKYAGGYQIYLAKSKKAKKKGKFKKVATIKKPETVKWTSKKLSKKLKGKRIYYKVRTYTKVGSKTYYGKWSKVKSVKVKK